MKWSIVFVIMNIITGCSTTVDYQRLRNVSTITIVDNPNLQGDMQGRALWDETHCIIELKHYPAYLGHEMRHCFEGQWHGDNPNGVDHG